MEPKTHEFILVSPGYTVGFGNDVDRSSPAGFSIYFIRLNSQDAASRLLAGTPLPELPRGSVVVQGDVRAPEGLPRRSFDFGSVAIESMDDALTVVARAMANPQSVLSQNGFSSATPVYVVHVGRAAKKVVPPTIDDL